MFYNFFLPGKRKKIVKKNHNFGTKRFLRESNKKINARLDKLRAKSTSHKTGTTLKHDLKHDEFWRVSRVFLDGYMFIMESRGFGKNLSMINWPCQYVINFRFLLHNSDHSAMYCMYDTMQILYLAKALNYVLSNYTYYTYCILGVVNLS